MDMDRGTEVLGWVIFAFALGFISPAFTIVGLFWAAWVGVRPKQRPPSR